MTTTEGSAMPARLLVIDDDEEICRFVRTVAEMERFDVRTATDAETFRVLYKETTPQVVILDLAIPQTDGIELLRFLATENSPARIFIMSAFDPRVRDAAERLGQEHGLTMVGVIPKPVRAMDLRALLAGARDKL
jgi:DNA-binding response OmpR family regulator